LLESKTIPDLDEAQRFDATEYLFKGSDQTELRSRRTLPSSLHSEAIVRTTFTRATVIALGGNVVLGLNQTTRVVLGRHVTQPDIAR
jgi:hypothetical protein